MNLFTVRLLFSFVSTLGRCDVSVMQKTRSAHSLDNQNHLENISFTFNPKKSS